MRLNLRGVNLAGVDLREVNLAGEDLRGAHLAGAKYGATDLIKYLSIGPIGSRQDYLQAFITDTDTILATGCWTGTLDELAARSDRADYQAVIPFIAKMAEITRGEKNETEMPEM